MNPKEIKEKQQQAYDAKTIKVSRGELGYVPVKKSRFSKSCSLKFNQ